MVNTIVTSTRLFVHLVSCSTSLVHCMLHFVDISYIFILHSCHAVGIAYSCLVFNKMAEL